MSSFQLLPEVLYADTTARRRDYEALSHRYAASGNVFGAVHATFAADVSAVQAVMWERVMVACPEPDQQFEVIGDAVSRALGAQVRSESVGSTAAELVELARRGMDEAFDPATQRLIAQAYLPLDHLAEAPAPDPGAGEEVAWERLRGDDATTVVAKRRERARADLEDAVRLAGEGRLEDAVRQAWRADWAAFEAYLIEAASAVGDESLVTVAMRWDMAVDAVSAIQTLPPSFEDAVAVLRAVFVRVLGSVEGSRLREQLLPVDVTD